MDVWTYGRQFNARDRPYLHTFIYGTNACSISFVIQRPEFMSEE